jgi:hypothetical protein
MTTKQQLNIRISNLTRQQLTDLVSCWGMTESEVISILLDRETTMTASKNTKTLYERAESKVDASPTLRKYREFILSDWHEGDDHLRWVISAPVKEIVSWAEAGQK